MSSHSWSFVSARDPEEFLSAPGGRCVLGSSYVIWCAGPELVGSIVWGKVDDVVLRELFSITSRVQPTAPSSSRHELLDCRHVESVDAHLLLGAIPPLSLPPGSQRHRSTVLVPDGITGILLAGALISFIPKSPFRVVHDLDEALAAVEVPSAQPAHAAAESLANLARGPSALILRLRAQIARALTDATVGDCAVALHVSTRSLQRELSRLGTSFSAELCHVRVTTAADLIRLTSIKLEAVAEHVGFGTSSRMSAMLRRVLGTTASELRNSRHDGDALELASAA